MSDTENEQLPDAAFDENEAVEAAEAETARPEKPASPRSWTGLLALVAAAVALAGVGYLLVNDFREQQAASQNDDSLARLAARIDEGRETVAALNDQLAERVAENEALRDEISQLRSVLSDPSRFVGNLPSRTAALERGLSSLQGVSAGTRDNWLLAEAEYFMQIANAQLQLAGNPELAANALRQADERIADLSNPAYTDVRTAISDELAALALVNDVDITGLSMTLGSLSRVVDNLPVQRAGRSLDSDETAELDPELSGGARAWESVKGAMSGLVKVSKPDETGSPLLTPDAEVLLRANLSLQLQAARLALLKGEQAIFDQSLDDADTWIETYFDTASVQVQDVRATIADLRANPAMGDMPDISESLRRLRQFRVLEDSGE